MSRSDSDEDLRRAIALSLQQPSPSRECKTPPVIDLVSDDDDDLDAPQKVPSSHNRHTKAFSSVSGSSKGEPSQKKTDSERSTPVTSALDTGSQKPSHTTGLLGIDRKAMEAERLARAQQRKKQLQEQAGTPIDTAPRKRKASQSPPLEENSSLAGKAMESRAKRQETPQATSERPSAKPVMNQSDHFIGKGIQFPDGVVKRTWALGCPRSGDDIKIEEVLQKNDLKLAVLSAFQIEGTWIESKLDPKTKVVWVLQAKDELERQAKGATKNPYYRFCFPCMDGQINCMHAKLQLLVYPTHLRVVVPSANLTSYDWGETGVMENICFLIDLPRLSPTKKPSSQHFTQFGEDLLHFAHALGLEEGMVFGLKNFDFSRTAKLGFVHSIGGAHTGQSYALTGYCGLATTVRRLGLDTDAPIELDMIASSLGNLTAPFVRAIYCAARGGDVLTEYDLRYEKASKVKGNQKEVSVDPWEYTRIHFPSESTVANSRGGRGAGGTLCFSPKWFDSKDFPHDLMRECLGSRKGMLLHSKMWFVRPKRISADKPNKAWAYVGSANISDSAWGKLVKDRSTKEPKLNCRNWECGVIFPVEGETAVSKQGEFLGWDVFQGTIPIPMVVPAEGYGKGRPWFFTEKVHS